MMFINYRVCRGMLAMAVCCLVSIGCTQSHLMIVSVPEGEGMVCESFNGTGRQLELQIIRAVNAERGKHGLKPLRAHDGLANLAREHGREMAQDAQKREVLVKISHDGFMARSVAAQRSYGLSHVGENVAGNWGYGNAVVAKTVAGWMHSPGHRKNILSHWGVTGVGVYQAPNGAVYITQLFGSLPKRYPLDHQSFRP